MKLTWVCAFSAKPCCAVLCCAVLCYAVLCCAVLCCAVLCLLYRFTLHQTASSTPGAGHAVILIGPQYEAKLLIACTQHLALQSCAVLATASTACALQGTLLRTAVALGWEACFLLPGCCDPFNDKALKAGRGAAFKLPIAEGNWGELRRVLQRHDMQCYGASPHTHDSSASAQELQQQNAPVTKQTSGAPHVAQDRTQDQSQHEADGSKAMCIVLGSEGQGLSETAREHSTPLAIPMAGPMESLNVSQAGAILMYAFGGNTSLLHQRAQTPQRTL